MQPSDWIEQLFTYGPYAVLALFVLWVAPRQTRQFIACEAQDVGSRLLCGGIAVGCWLVVVTMVWFIYHAWSPRTAYTGSLGTYAEEVEFVPAHPNFFIATQLRTDGRLTWKFAIVADLRSNEPFEFTYVWGREETEYTDYKIESELLRRGPLRIMANPDDPRVLFYETGDSGNSHQPLATAVASRAIEQTAMGSWMAAHAQEPPERHWLRAFDSNNRYFQAQARHKIRRLSDRDLRTLSQRSNLSKKARDAVNRELKSRE